MSKFNPDKPYDQLLTAEISDRNGFFDVRGFFAELHAWCVKHNPLNRGIWDDLDKDEQAAIRKGKAIFFEGSDETQFPQKSVPAEFKKALEEKYKSQARKAARQSRIDANWSDITDQPGHGHPGGTPESQKTYLIDPKGSDGRDKGNRQPYGPYTGGLDYIGEFKFFGKKKKYLV